MKKHRNLIALVAMLTLVAALMVGCGGSSDSSDSSSTGTETTSTDTGSTATDPGAATESVTLDADPGGALAYVQKTLTAKPGTLAIDFTNDSPIPHDVAINDAQGNEVAASETITGSSTTVDVAVKPGKYTYYCTLPGHEEAGMKGVLTVK